LCQDTLINRLRAEFLEVLGLRLKSERVQRLCRIERMICQMVLDSLGDEKVRCVKADEQYARRTDGHHPDAAKPDYHDSSAMVRGTTSVMLRWHAIKGDLSGGK
jgi:hypothetical protein